MVFHENYSILEKSKSLVELKSFLFWYEFTSIQGTPSPDLEQLFEPRLDPAAWNKHFQEKKSLRFALANTPDQELELLKENVESESRRRSGMVMSDIFVTNG